MFQSLVNTGVTILLDSQNQRRDRSFSLDIGLLKNGVRKTSADITNLRAKDTSLESSLAQIEIDALKTSADISS